MLVGFESAKTENSRGVPGGLGLEHLRAIIDRRFGTVAEAWRGMQEAWCEHEVQERLQSEAWEMVGNLGTDPSEDGNPQMTKEEQIMWRRSQVMTGGEGLHRRRSLPMAVHSANPLFDWPVHTLDFEAPPASPPL